MPYTPDPTNAAEPLDTELARTAAAEFRALKAYLQDTVLPAFVLKAGDTMLGLLEGPDAEFAALRVNGIAVGYRKLPAASVATGTPVAEDAGKCIYATGNVTIPDAVFAQGDCLTIFNITTGPITIVEGITDLFLSGTATTGDRTLAQKGVATVLFASGVMGSIGGSGLT